MTDREVLLSRACSSTKRALEGQTPKTLRAYSFAIDHAAKKIYLRAHFGETPSEGDLEDISVVETEVDANLLDHLDAETDVEIVPPGETPAFLADGIAYLREGEAGSVCIDRRFPAATVGR